jgi:hypothetical protein
VSTRRGVLTAVALGGVGAAAFALLQANAPIAVHAEPAIDRRDVTGPPTAKGEPRVQTIDEAALDEKLGRAKWLAVGGGAWPEATQVQIEQDIGLATDVLGDGGVVLFGAGAGAPVVQVQRPGVERDRVGIALSDLFAPRGGRDATYRAPKIHVDAEATATRVLSALERALAGGDDPLLVYVAGHGEIGQTAKDNRVSLWAGSSITAMELARAVDRGARPVRFVVTTCFSGGFAELAFTGADETAAAPDVARCGLFASTWDLEASGCDPNPDRGAQEGYALHFLGALQGRDRDGGELPIATLDLDGDGAVGLLDAHTRVRIASKGVEVPTTTSERWLRARAPTSGAQVEIDVPEEDAVIAALGRQLGLDEDAAAPKLAALEASIEQAQLEVDRTRAAEDEAYRAAAAELLARWPILDDPWHPDFANTFRGQRDAIGGVLDRSEHWAAYVAAREAAGVAAAKHADLAAEAAPVERLVRAIETKALAERLAAVRGPAFETWERLRTCERWTPPRGRMR